MNSSAHRSLIPKIFLSAVDYFSETIKRAGGSREKPSARFFFAPKIFYIVGSRFGLARRRSQRVLVFAEHVIQKRTEARRVISLNAVDVLRIEASLELVAEIIDRDVDVLLTVDGGVERGSDLFEGDLVAEQFARQVAIKVLLIIGAAFSHHKRYEQKTLERSKQFAEVRFIAFDLRASDQHERLEVPHAKPIEPLEQDFDLVVKLVDVEREMNFVPRLGQTPEALNVCGDLLGLEAFFVARWIIRLRERTRFVFGLVIDLDVDDGNFFVVVFDGELSIVENFFGENLSKRNSISASARLMSGLSK